MLFQCIFLLLLLSTSFLITPVRAENTYINIYQGKDINTIKADSPKEAPIEEESEPSNLILDTNIAGGGNTYSTNYSIGATLAYKLSQNYHSGLAFYLYSYKEAYSKSAPEASNWVDPHSTAKLDASSLVIAWYNEYQVSRNTIMFAQVGIPLGHSNNNYDSWVNGFDNAGEWVEGEAKGSEYFNGVFTMDIGFKYYFTHSFYLGGQYRFFASDIDVNEDITPNDGDEINRNLKNGRYNTSSLLFNIGYTFKSN